MIEALSIYDYPAICLDLPSVGAWPPLRNFDPDVAHIRAAVSKLVVEEGKEVILAMHSYGGVPGNEAMRGLSRDSQMASGLEGGVIKLVFIAAYMLDIGSSILSGDPDNMQEWKDKVPSCIEVDDLGHTFRFTTKAFQMLYNDLEPATAAQWICKLRPQSAGVLFSKTTYTAWRDVPTTVIVCKDDNMMPPALMEQFVQVVKDGGGDIKVEVIDGGHSPFLARVDELVVILRHAAGDDRLG